MINRVVNISYNRIKNKMNKMGYIINPLIFIYMRLISSLILFIVLLFFLQYGYLIAPIVTVLYYIFVEVVILDFNIKVRADELENDALDFIPILLLGLKGERNVRKALVYSTEIVDNSLSDEFKKVLGNEKIGKTLDEALLEMKMRIPSDFILNMITSICEANRLGNSINESIGNQLSYIESKKKRKIINSYKIIPFKMAIASVVFIFAVILLLAVCSI